MSNAVAVIHLLITAITVVVKAPKQSTLLRLSLARSPSRIHFAGPSAVMIAVAELGALKPHRAQMVDL